MSADLARAAGPVGAAGLVVLMLAPARYQRLGGLAAWAIGAAVLAAYLAPSGHVALLGAAAVAGLLLAAAGAYVLRRWPWLLALATLACVPARIPVTIGSTEANLLVPLYAVVAAAALALAWDFVRGDERRRELGPVALPLAVFVAWTGLSLAWSQDVRQGAIELLAFYLPFGLIAVSLSRLHWRARWVTALYVELAVMGSDLRRGRDRAVDHARHLLEPQAARRQHVRALLPRQLGLLGPVDLRPLPGCRDPGDTGRGSAQPLRACAARGRRRDRARLGRPALLVFAVELPRAHRRSRARGRVRVGTAGDRAHRDRRRRVPDCGGRGAERPPRPPPPYERRREPRDERPLEARHERRQDRCPPPRCRRRRRRLQARVREAGTPALEGVERQAPRTTRRSPSPPRRALSGSRSSPGWSSAAWPSPSGGATATSPG